MPALSHGHRLTYSKCFNRWNFLRFTILWINSRCYYLPTKIVLALCTQRILSCNKRRLRRFADTWLQRYKEVGKLQRKRKKKFGKDILQSHGHSVIVTYFSFPFPFSMSTFFILFNTRNITFNVACCMFFFTKIEMKI